MYFCYFIIISPWKRAEPFIWINLNPLNIRMLCGKFDWNWPCGSGEEDENVKSLWQRKQQQRPRRLRQRTNFDQKTSILKLHFTYIWIIIITLCEFVIVCRYHLEPKNSTRNNLHQSELKPTFFVVLDKIKSSDEECSVLKLSEFGKA